MILEQLGIAFDVVVPDVDEREHGPPDEVARENARRKAERVAESGQCRDGAVVLGVDTVVALGGRIYGKPADVVQARTTLGMLAGRVHTVVSGVCVVGPAAARTAVCRTEVEFRPVGADLLDWYLASGEWRERAGGYAIQGRGAALVARIDGDYSNVVGLPVTTLLDLMPEILGRGGP